MIFLSKCLCKGSIICLYCQIYICKCFPFWTTLKKNDRKKFSKTNHQIIGKNLLIVTFLMYLRTKIVYHGKFKE